jgi:SAM-dependent methyltransferase
MYHSNSCPLCGSHRFSLLVKHTFRKPTSRDLEGELGYVQERLNVFFEYILQCEEPAEIEIDLCLECGLVFSNPRYTEAEISTKYRVIEGLESSRRRTEKSPALRTGERAGRIFQLLSVAMGRPLSSLDVLDYGGAEGYNLVPFTAVNNCFLVDYVSSALPEGVTYLGSELNSIDPESTFDIVLLCHILEHAIEPLSLAASLSSRLKQGGLMYLEVPLGVFREWKVLEEPLTHVNFFSEESAARCLEEAGLEVIHVSTDYQWVTRSRSWCVNALGRKSDSGGRIDVSFKTTHSQMKNPLYYVRPGLRKLARPITRRSGP